MVRGVKRKLPQNEIKVAFDDKTVDLKIDQIVPIKLVSPAVRKSPKYQQIVASIREVGIIEPPVVSRSMQAKGKYILLDGHLRFEALKELGQAELTCLVSTDDESFTYNKHINRLSTVQEHKMIVRAIERGVSEKKIAQALNVDVDHIVRKRTLLEGICPEVIEMFKDKMVAVSTFPVLRRMVFFRQIEAAQLMIAANVFSRSYADAIYAATPKDQLAEPDKPKKVKGLDDEQMSLMEGEMASLQREYKLAEKDYSRDVLNLQLAKSYLGSLLSNNRVERYLAQNHPEFLKQFQKIAEMPSLKAAA